MIIIEKLEALQPSDLTLKSPTACTLSSLHPEQSGVNIIIQKLKALQPTGLEKTRVFLKKPSPVGFFGFFLVFFGFFGFFWVFLPGRESF